MTAEAVLVLVAVGVVTVAVAVYVLLPLARGDRPRPPADPRLVALLAERESLLASLRDLEADYRDGRLLEEDYQVLRAEVVARGSAILAALDRLAEAAAGESAALAAAIEADVAALAACPVCGRPVGGADRYCAGCGRALSDRAPAVG